MGIDFELATQGDSSLDENDATIKAMTESARQLGLEIDLESHGNSESPIVSFREFVGIE